METSTSFRLSSHCRPFRRRAKQQQQQSSNSSAITTTSQSLPNEITSTHLLLTQRLAETTTNNTTTTQQSHRYSSTPAPAATRLLYLSIVACVIMSLLNLTNTVTSLQTASSSQVTSQSTLLQQQQQQQQQSNSVISQYTSQTMSSSNTTPRAKYKTMYACEDRQLTMDCETGSKINLIRANFGRFSITQCNEQGQLDLSIDCMSPITFRIMQERCQDRQRCSVNATSMLFGDKCPKTRKYLEVHFQCQTVEPDMVDVRKSNQSLPLSTQIPPIHGPGSGPVKPANNPTSTQRPGQHGSQPSQLEVDLPIAQNDVQQQQQQPQQQQQQRPQQHQHHQPTSVINSGLMTYVNAINGNANGDLSANKLPDIDVRGERIVVVLRHIQFEDMSRPRCYQWDQSTNQWTDRGAQMLETNQTHTICAFDQASSYVLVMDYSGPLQTISTTNPTSKQPPIPSQPSTYPASFGLSPQDILESQPIPLDSNYPSATIPSQSPTQQRSPYTMPNQFDINKMIYPPSSQNTQQQQQQQNQQSTTTRLFTLFGYLLAIIFVAIVLLTLAFVGSSMRSSAGSALKSFGNFVPFGGPKYKQRRQPGGPPSLHSNKDLLVINNSNGHQFIYAPASTTKISSSSSTHILSAGQPTGLVGQHQGTLHRIQQQQQQQMYSGNGATLSSLSGAGAQSNNYYYGLMGLNPIFQQQQQQQQQQQSHHFSQHHLNNTQQQNSANYNHQANKSTASAESANSSSSSSGVESGSASMQQQQQQQTQTQQACLVTNMNCNDFNLMSHHLSSNYGQHQQQQQHNLFASVGQQPALTLNAHYSTSGGMNILPQSQAGVMALHSRQASGQLRDHIYECVDDEKPYMARLLMPSGNNEHQQQQFGTLGHNYQQQQQLVANNSRAMTLSSRLLHDVFQQHQQQQQQQQNCNSSASPNQRRNYPQPAIVRDNQAKTNIICSKLAQVTPQRATEVGGGSGSSISFQQHTDVMAIYNKDDTTTMTTAAQQPTSTNNSCYGQRLAESVTLNNHQGGKLSTDC